MTRLQLSDKLDALIQAVADKATTPEEIEIRKQDILDKFDAILNELTQERTARWWGRSW